MVFRLELCTLLYTCMMYCTLVPYSIVQLYSVLNCSLVPCTLLSTCTLYSIVHLYLYSIVHLYPVLYCTIVPCTLLYILVPGGGGRASQRHIFTPADNARSERHWLTLVQHLNIFPKNIQLSIDFCSSLVESNSDSQLT